MRETEPWNSEDGPQAKGEIKMRYASKHGKPGRFLAGLLSLSMVFSMFGSFSGFNAASETSAAGDTLEPSEVTQGVKNRQADPSTMDTYREMLDFSDNTRYAGRIWTDKSVFAYGEDATQTIDSALKREFNGDQLTLNEELDGVDGSIALDADFLEVYSALGSSIAVNTYPRNPIDLVIAIDMSASMGQDTRYEIDGFEEANFNLNNGPYYDLNEPVNDYEKEDAANRTMSQRIANSRIQKTLEAVNTTIDDLMDQNPNNRVSVILYGAGATAILPLAHYQRVDPETPYLEVTSMIPIYDMRDLVYNQSYGWIWVKNRDTLYTVTANAKYNLSNESVVNNETAFNEDDCGFGEANDVSGTLNVTVSNDVAESFMKPDHIVSYDNWHKNFFEDKYVKVKQDLTEPTLATPSDAVGYFTNTQGGIYLALSQLAKDKYTTYSEDGAKVVRVPAAIIMTDGGANFAFNEMSFWSDDLREENNPNGGHQYKGKGYYYGSHQYEKNGENKVEVVNGFLTDQQPNADPIDNSHRLKPSVGSKDNGNLGDEWYHVYLPGIQDKNKITSLYNPCWYENSEYRMLGGKPNWANAGILYSNDDDVFGTSGTVLQVLMTASYMKTAVKKHYQEGWKEAQISKENWRELQMYTLSVDADHVPQWGKMRLYPTMDPKNYFIEDTEWWNDSEKFGNSDLDYGQTLDKVYGGMKETWNTWKGNEEKKGMNTDANINYSTIRININRIPEENIYNEDFGVSITNEDVEENIVYNDGFYDIASGKMGDIFDQIFSLITGSIFAPLSDTVQNDVDTTNSVTFVDPIGKYMEVKDVKNLVLFGEKYDITKTAVYSYKFNQAYIQEHRNEEGATENGFLKDGWYQGEDGASADYGGDGLSPSLNGKAEAAWTNGWVYRLGAKTASAYVPSLEDINTGDPEDAIVQKMRSTEYTFYRVNEDETERNRLRMNPAYGDPENDNVLESNSGAYRLNDLRIWVEDTGNYSDGTVGGGGLQTDTSYDQALWIDIPRDMLPLRTVTLTQNKPTESEKGNGWTYTTNLSENDPGHTASFPLRVFYTVGMAESIVNGDGSIKVADVGAEYVKNNKVATEAARDARALEIGDLEFFFQLVQSGKPIRRLYLIR